MPIPAMSRDPDVNAPPTPAAPASEESVVRSPSSHRDDGTSSDDEEQVHDVDPHPDTPDDFDDDASSPRQSEEAIPEDDR